jgi:hypothetical protein
MRRFHSALFVLVLVLLAAQSLMASTHYVGSCKTGAYPTISAAVAAVPAGSTIEVCPGTYHEQVVISQPLTLEAIPTSTTGPVTISDVGVSLVTTTSLYWGTIAPQVEVTAGPVNITNITVRGTGASTGCPATVVGVFYGSGSSGTVKGAEVIDQGCAGDDGSVGIIAENGAGAMQSVTIENSYISGQATAGISVHSNQVPTSSLTGVVKNNHLTGNPSAYGILSLGNAHGSISNNFITTSFTGAGSTGVWAGSCCVPVTGNWIWNQNIGIDIEGTIVSVTSNQIFGSATSGINIAIGGVTVSHNGITAGNGGGEPGGVGIEFNCNTSVTATGNTVNGPNTGFDEFPGTSTGTNKFYNVPTVKTGCS